MHVRNETSQQNPENILYRCREYFDTISNEESPPSATIDATQEAVESILTDRNTYIKYGKENWQANRT